jgi:hypothetical protein
MKVLARMVALVGSAALAATAADVKKVPAHDQFVIIPIRVHVLTSKDLELANSRITDAEVMKSIPKINAIWNKAGLHFGLESIVREPAAQVDRFKAIVALREGQFENADPFAYLLPTATRISDGLNVYIFRELPLNGVYIPAADATLAKEKPQLNRVEGGSDDPLGRVIARGLGQALRLEGRTDAVGLLSSGTNGVGLGEAEVGRARQFARTIPGALGVAQAAGEAEAAAKKGDVVRARLLWTWLAEVPGADAAAARKKLSALPQARP